jgi:hypothetical protein
MTDDAPASKFPVGSRVVAKRERRMIMDVTDAQPTGRAGGPLYRCVPCEEHAPSHGRGRSPRWFREDDLDAAP